MRWVIGTQFIATVTWLNVALAAYDRSTGEFCVALCLAVVATLVVTLMAKRACDLAYMQGYLDRLKPISKLFMERLPFMDEMLNKSFDQLGPGKDVHDGG